MLPGLDYKRILFAILLVVVSASLLFGIIWLVFLRSPAVDDLPNGNGVIPGGRLPAAGPGGDARLVGPGGVLPGGGEITNGVQGDKRPSEVAKGFLTQVRSLMDDEVKEVNLTSTGFNYLSGEDDKFYRLSFDGTDKFLLASEAFPHADNISWSPDNNKVILEYPDGANILYDFTRNKKVVLPKGAEDLVFDSSSDKIAYKYIGASEEDNWLVVSDINNTQAKAVEPIGMEGDKVQVSWSPNNQVVALYHEPTGLESEEVFFIGLNDENFRSLKVQGSNFKGKWSPGGTRILYHTISADNDYNPILWVADASIDSIGSNNFNLGLSTWVDKCVFSRDEGTVYCAVPVGLPQGAGLYPDLVNNKQDVFYEINLRTGVSKLIAYPVLSEELDEFQVKKLFVSDDGARLYFWDKWTEKVYYLRLR